MPPGRSRLGLVIAGMGLIVLGGASVFFLLPDRVDETQQATDFSAVPAPVDFAAPELSLNDLAGQQHSLSDYAGQVVLVNLWATWCPPCKAEMPILQAYHDRHRQDGFTVIAINDGDPAEDVRHFVNDYRLTFPVWLDPEYEASDRAFKTANLPSSYLVDRSGQVRFMWFGAINDANLEKYITPVILEN